MVEQLLTHRALRWFAAGGVAILWLAAAWGEPSVLLLLLVPGALWWLWQRRPVPDDGELTDLL